MVGTRNTETLNSKILKSLNGVNALVMRHIKTALADAFLLVYFPFVRGDIVDLRMYFVRSAFLALSSPIRGLGLTIRTFGV